MGEKVRTRPRVASANVRASLWPCDVALVKSLFDDVITLINIIIDVEYPNAYKARA